MRFKQTSVWCGGHVHQYLERALQRVLPLQPLPSHAILHLLRICVPTALSWRLVCPGLHKTHKCSEACTESQKCINKTTRNADPNVGKANFKPHILPAVCLLPTQHYQSTQQVPLQSHLLFFTLEFVLHTCQHRSQKYLPPFIYFSLQKDERKLLWHGWSAIGFGKGIQRHSRTQRLRHGFSVVSTYLNYSYWQWLAWSNSQKSPEI